MKIAIITDQHFGIRGDAKFMLDYQEKFYKEVFFPYLRKHNIKTLFNLGDLFDRRKYINFVTLDRARKMFLDVLEWENIQMKIIPGNHDVYHKGSNEISSLTQLLKQYKNVEIYEKPEIFSDIFNTKFAFIPWINNENYESIMSWIKNTSADILCGHLEISGFEMFAGVKNEHGMAASDFSKFSQVWTGHFHHKSSKQNIHYLGSPMEFTFNDCGDMRGFHIYDCETKQLEFIQNPYTLYEKLYYNDETEAAQKYFRELDCSVYAEKIIKVFVVKKTKPAIYDYFMEKMFTCGTVQLTVLEDYSDFENSDLSQDEFISLQEQSTKELMDKYVDGVDTEMDKEKIKNILHDIYVESIHNNEVAH